jgi:hypothetical protein
MYSNRKEGIAAPYFIIPTLANFSGILGKRKVRNYHSSYSLAFPTTIGAWKSNTSNQQGIRKRWKTDFDWFESEGKSRKMIGIQKVSTLAIFQAKEDWWEFKVGLLKNFEGP